MDKKYLKIHEKVNVFNSLSIDSEILQHLEEGDIVMYNREKRRKSKSFVEIYLNSNKKGYILKNTDIEFFQLVELKDEWAECLYIKSKNSQSVTINDFSYALENSFPLNAGNKRIELKVIPSETNNKPQIIYVDYNPKNIDVRVVPVKESHEFYYFGEMNYDNSDFIEIKNMKLQSLFCPGFTQFVRKSDFSDKLISVGVFFGLIGFSITLLIKFKGINLFTYVDGRAVILLVILYIIISVVVFSILLVIIKSIVKKLLNSIYRYF